MSKASRRGRRERGRQVGGRERGREKGRKEGGRDEGGREGGRKSLKLRSSNRGKVNCTVKKIGREVRKTNLKIHSQ